METWSDAASGPVPEVPLQTTGQAAPRPVPQEVQTVQPEVAVAAQDTSGESASSLAMQTMEDGQMGLFAPEDRGTDNGDILQFLSASGVQYVDKRANGGSLWILGGQELTDMVAKAKLLGYMFRLKADGGCATKNQPGWWTK